MVYVTMLAIAFIPVFAYISVMVTKPIMLIHLALAVSMIIVCCVVVGAVKKSVKRKADLAKKLAEDQFYTRGREIEKRIQECNKELKRLGKDESWITSESFEPGFNSKKRDVYSMTDKELDDFFLWLAYHPDAEKQYENTWFHVRIQRYAEASREIFDERRQLSREKQEAEAAGRYYHDISQEILSSMVKFEMDNAKKDITNMLDRRTAVCPESYQTKVTLATMSAIIVNCVAGCALNAHINTHVYIDDSFEKMFKELLWDYGVAAKTKEEKEFLQTVKMAVERIYKYSGRWMFSNFYFFKELGI